MPGRCASAARRQRGTLTTARSAHQPTGDEAYEAGYGSDCHGRCVSSFHGQRLYAAKVGEIAVRWSRPLPSEPSSVTVIREPDGRYYASFVVERDATPLPACGREIGVDVGLDRRVKVRRWVAVVHRKVRDTRLDHAHKTALALVRDNQAVYAEDLAVAGPARTRLAKAIHDRDVNAAKNILAAGRAQRRNACRGTIRPGATLAGPGETGTHRGAA